MVELTFDSPADAGAREHLLDLCFGEDRKQKAAYSLRQGVGPVDGLSRVARQSGQLVGTIQFWPVLVIDMLEGAEIDALLLGPIAVHPDLRSQGVARALLDDSLSRADAKGFTSVLLVGETALYEPFGFKPVRPCCITLPGGRDADRLMVRQNGIARSLPSVGQVVSPGLHREATRATVASSTPNGEALYHIA